jgi:hypothetical protein
MKYLISAICFLLLIYCGSSSAQIKLHNNIVGLSISGEIDNEVVIFSGNYEHELLSVGPGILGIGLCTRYINWDNVVNRNTIFAGQINYNFTNIGDGKLVPFMGFAVGSNIEFQDSYYWGQTGLRYFFNKNLSIIAKYCLSNRSNIAPEFGFEYKF